MLVCREPLTAIFCSPQHWMLFSKNCLLAQDIASIKNLCIGNETWSGTVYCLFMIVSSDPGYPLKLRRSRLRILFTRRSKCVTSCGAEWLRSLGRNPVRSWGELSSQTLCLNDFWIFFSACRHHQHPHPVHLRRHGDPAHRDQVGLQGPERWLLHQPVSKPKSYL